VPFLQGQDIIKVSCRGILERDNLAYPAYHFWPFRMVCNILYSGFVYLLHFIHVYTKSAAKLSAQTVKMTSAARVLEE